MRYSRDDGNVTRSTSSSLILLPDELILHISSYLCYQDQRSFFNTEKSTLISLKR
jgi:hypothetical protein